jgi:hypothetical protein
MKFRLMIAVLLCCSLFLSACQPAAPTAAVTEASNGETQTTEQPQETLSADMGGVTGKVVSSITNQPLGETIVRLAEVVRQEGQAAFVLDTAFSPGVVTDADGNFSLVNIPAMEYVIVVGNVEIYQGYEILQDASGQALTYTVEAGEVLDVGELRVGLTGDEY